MESAARYEFNLPDNLTEHDPIAAAFGATRDLICEWGNAVVDDYMGTVGPEDNASRFARTKELVHDGMSQGFTACFRDPARTGGEMAASFTEAAVVGLPVGMVAPLIGWRGALVCGIAAFGVAIVMPAIPKLQAMQDATKDYWNNPQNADADRQIIAQNTPVLLDSMARFNGLLVGQKLGLAGVCAIDQLIPGKYGASAFRI